MKQPTYILRNGYLVKSKVQAKREDYAFILCSCVGIVWLIATSLVVIGNHLY